MPIEVGGLMSILVGGTEVLITHGTVEHTILGIMIGHGILPGILLGTTDIMAGTVLTMDGDGTIRITTGDTEAGMEIITIIMEEEHGTVGSVRTLADITVTDIAGIQPDVIIHRGDIPTPAIMDELHAKLHQEDKVLREE